MGAWSTPLRPADRAPPIAEPLGCTALAKKQTSPRQAAAPAPHRRRGAPPARQQRRRTLVTVISGLVVIAIVLRVRVRVGPARTTTATSNTSTRARRRLRPARRPRRRGSARAEALRRGEGPAAEGRADVPVTVGRPPTKLVTKDLKVGTGAVVTAGQTVTVDYIGVVVLDRQDLRLVVLARPAGELPARPA